MEGKFVCKSSGPSNGSNWKFQPKNLPCSQQTENGHSEPPSGMKRHMTPLIESVRYLKIPLQSTCQKLLTYFLTKSPGYVMDRDSNDMRFNSFKKLDVLFCH